MDRLTSIRFVSWIHSLKGDRVYLFIVYFQIERWHNQTVMIEYICVNKHFLKSKIFIISFL